MLLPHIDCEVCAKPAKDGAIFREDLLRSIEILLDLEWSGWDDDSRRAVCPVCNASRPRLKRDRPLGHMVNCALDIELRKYRKEILR
jgi:hypothetical protein